MPYIGLVVHLLVAIYFAVHAVRSGQPIFWLVVLFSFPLLGSLVYFLAIYLPNSRLDTGARKAVAAAAKTLDPGRTLREARAAFEYTPTAQNQMALAAALLDAGQAEEAAQNYEDCLKGPFAADLEIRFGAARACHACSRFAEAAAHLLAIRQADAKLHAEPLSLLLAQTLAALGHRAEAQAEFESALARFGSFDCRAEYTIWALGCGDIALAARLQPDLERAMARWSRLTRELNAPTLRRLSAARALASQRE